MAPNVCVLRSAVAAASRNRFIQRARELQAFLSSNRPHQRLYLLEDVYHAQIDGAYRELAKTVAAQSTFGGNDSHTADAKAAPESFSAPTHASADAMHIETAAEGEDDLLLSLLADVELDVAPLAAVPPASAAAPIRTVAPIVNQPGVAIGAASSRVSVVGSAPALLLECRLLAAATWLASHLSTQTSLSSQRPLIVLLVPDAPGHDASSCTDQLTALICASRPELAVSQEEAASFITSSGGSLQTRLSSGVAVMTLSHYVQASRPLLAAPLSAQSTSVALKHRSVGNASSGSAADARYNELAAMLSSLQDAHRQAVSSAMVRERSALATATAVASTNGRGGSSASLAPTNLARKPSLYPPHASAGDLATWLRQGFRPAAESGLALQSTKVRVLRGTFRRGGRSGKEATVTISCRFSVSGPDGATAESSASIHAPRQIRLIGRTAFNRAMDGDEVAVELLSSSSPTVATASSTSTASSYTAADDDVSLPRLTSFSVDADVVDEESVTSSANAPIVSITSAETSTVPCGRVIGIIRRRTAPIVATVPLDPSSSLSTEPTTEDADPLAASAGGGAVLASRKAQWLLVVPMDPRLPKIRLRSRQVERLAGHRILVSVDRWPDDSAYPEGHRVSTIGRALELDTEVQCVMLNTGVHTHARPFPPAAVADLPVLPPSGRWSVAWDRLQRTLKVLGALRGSDTPSAAGLAAALHQSGGANAGRIASSALQRLTSSALSGVDGAMPPLSDHQLERSLATALASHADSRDRRDLRWSHEICSVDPPGCTDIDDALHARLLPDSAEGGGASTKAAGRRAAGAISSGLCRIEVGVHIADVTAFVPHGSDLDLEARARATTVYLVDRRLDMLPTTLSENVCSLRARVDRYAFSVIWELRELPGSTDAQPLWEVVADRTWVGRTVIRSTHALTYDQAKRIIAGKRADEDGGAAALAAAAAAATGVASSGSSPKPAAAAEGLSDASFSADVTSNAAVAADSTSASCGPLPESISSAVALADPVSADFASMPGLSAALTPSLLDPSSTSPEALERLRREAELYPSDPPEGGLCGAPVHPADEPRLRQSLSLMTSVARWLNQRRGASGALDFERGELRFVLQKTGDGVGGDSGRGALVGGSTAAAADSELQDFALPAAKQTTSDGSSSNSSEVAGELATGPDSSAGDVDVKAAAAAPSVEPVAVVSKHQEEIHITIAELMIFANMATAKLAYSAFPDCALLRHHAPADVSRFTELVSVATAAGFTVDVSSNGALQQSLVSMVAQLDRQAAERAKAGNVADSANLAQAALLRSLALRAMTRAAYFATASASTGASAAAVATAAGGKGSGVSGGFVRTAGGAYIPGLMSVSGPPDFSHYGLAVDLYTHFTSPIRRYADDVVHKLLTSALGLHSGPDSDVVLLRRLADIEEAEQQPSSITSAGKPAASLAKPVLPASSTPSVAGLIDWRLGDRPQGATIADTLPSSAFTSHSSAGASAAADAALSDTSADGQDALLDSLLGGLDDGGGGAASAGDVSMSDGPPPATAPKPAGGAWSQPLKPAADNAMPDQSPAPSSSQLGGPAREASDAASVAPSSPPVLPPPFPHEVLDGLASHLNERNQAAKVAGWECNELFLALYFRQRVEVTEAVVSDITVKSSSPSSSAGGFVGADSITVTVYLPKYQFAAPLHLTLPASKQGHLSVSGSFSATGATAAAIAVPPSLLGMQGDSGARGSGSVDGNLVAGISTPRQLLSSSGIPNSDHDALPALAKGTAAIASRVPAEARAALLSEGALRVPLSGASLQLAQGARGSKGSLAVIVQPPSASSGRPFTISLLDRVQVAITCVFDVTNARRPPIVVELVADTPTVRQLATSGGSEGAKASVKEEEQQPSGGAQVAAATETPSQVPTAAEKSLPARPPRSSVYNAISQADSASLAAAAAAAAQGELPGSDASSHSAKRQRRAASLPASRSSTVSRVVPGRSRYGGYRPPPPLRPQDLHEASPWDDTDGASSAFVGRSRSAFGSASGLGSRLEYYGHAIGCKQAQSAAPPLQRQAPSGSRSAVRRLTPPMWAGCTAQRRRLPTRRNLAPAWRRLTCWGRMAGCRARSGAQWTGP